MNILIGDHEPLAVMRLSRLVSQLGHQVVATAQDGKQVIKLAQLYQPDVILVDIEMPEIAGLTCEKFLSQLSPMPAVVFYTAYDQHVLDAIQLQADGYLLKPTTQSELQHVLNNLTKLTRTQKSNLEKKEAMEKITQRQQIVAKTYRGVELIPTENIYYFLADQKYVAVRHKNGSVLIDETLKELEHEFADKFIRIHRNALISLDYLDGLELITSGQYQARCREIEERLAVSRRHLPILRERIHHL